MKSPICSDIRAWLETEGQAPPPAELLEHIAGCSFCQGGLTLIAIAGQEGVQAMDCAECQRYLPELIEALDGRWRLQDEHVQALIHICTCADCRETYRLVALLRAAEQVGTLGLPPRTGVPIVERSRVNLLTLSRDFLNLMIPVRGPSAAVMRGAEEAETVIATTETSYGFSLHVSVKAEATDAWTLTVTLNPAPSGWIEVHLGQVLFRAPLHADGTARLFDIPSALLNAPDGPALAITLTLAPAEQGF